MGLEEVQERKDEDTEIHKDGGGTENVLGTWDHLYQSAFLSSRTKKAFSEKTLDSSEALLQKSTDNKATHCKLSLFKE